MSDKQALLAIIRALPEDATWDELTTAVVEFVRQRASVCAPDAEPVRPDAVVFAELRSRL